MMQEVAAGVFVESSYAPYNLGLIKIEGGALAVDIPPRPSDAAQWLSHAEEAVGPVRYAVLTNATLDRLIAAAFWHVPVIAAERAARILMEKDDKAWNELLREKSGRYPDEMSAFSALKLPRVALAFNQRMLIYRQDAPLTFESVSGLLPGSLWVFVPDESILFAGESVSVDEFPLITKDIDLNAWFNLLTTLENRHNVRRIVAGRGRALVRPGELEGQREFLHVLMHTVRKLIRDDVSTTRVSEVAWDLVQAFFPNTPRQSVRMQCAKQALTDLIAKAQAPVLLEEDED